MMRIDRISVRNWKNFGNAELHLGDRLFIVGANASGKSNLLDIFRFMKDITNIGFQKAIENRGGIKKIRYLNSRNPSYIEINIELTEFNNDEMTTAWLYLLQFNSTGGTTHKTEVNISLEQVVRDGEILLSRKYNDPDEDNMTRQFTYLQQPAINNKYRALYDYFKNITYVSIIPQLIKDTNVGIPPIMQEDYYGRNLLYKIADLPERQRNSRLNAISKVLKLAVPQFSELQFIKDEKGDPHLQVRYEHFRSKGAYQREDQFSDGTLRLIGIIWAILDGNGLLLLEEPELYLHSEIVKQLPAFIARAQKQKNGRRQVIISSHSFDILNTNTIGPEEVAILRPEKEGTKIEIANTLEGVNNLIAAGFTPADAIIPMVTPKGIADGQLSLFDFS